MHDIYIATLFDFLLSHSSSKHLCKPPSHTIRWVAFANLGQNDDATFIFWWENFSAMIRFWCWIPHHDQWWLIVSSMSTAQKYYVVNPNYLAS